MTLYWSIRQRFGSYSNIWKMKCKIKHFYFISVLNVIKQNSPLKLAFWLIFRVFFLISTFQLLFWLKNQRFVAKPFVWDERCSNQMIVMKSHHYKQTDLMYCAFEIEILAWWDVMGCDTILSSIEPYSKQQIYVYQLK